MIHQNAQHSRELVSSSDFVGAKKVRDRGSSCMQLFNSTQLRHRLFVTAVSVVACFALWINAGHMLHDWSTNILKRPVFDDRTDPYDGKEYNTRPVIGILTVPIEHGEPGRECVTRRLRRRLETDEAKVPTSCFNSVYARWLEGSGAQVVPIPFNLPKTGIDELLGSVNGVLFTGGDVPLREAGNPYVATARHIFERVIEINRAGKRFPLWGTCMGIQLLSILVGGPGVLEFGNFQGVDGTMLPLNFTSKAMQSQLYGPDRLGAASQIVLKSLAKFPVTTNYHHDGVDPASFEGDTALAQFFDVLSTNVDAKGKPFVSTIEAKSGMPIFGVQFHPERSQYDFRSPHDPVNHSARAVAVNSWFSNFFVNQARGNSNSFEPGHLENALIWNYPSRPSSGHGNYFF